jgi:hypothetical protein
MGLLIGLGIFQRDELGLGQYQASRNRLPPPISVSYTRSWPRDRNPLEGYRDKMITAVVDGVHQVARVRIF